MIDFSTLQGLTIPEGVVTQITDASGRVLWKAVATDDEPAVILEVTKQTNASYAGETQHTDNEFVLFDIYPKTNGTVKVTYGGLTKTITDTSGAEQPNAQQVFFGKFNGESDSVTTPTSGTLTIEGAYRGYGLGSFGSSSGKSSGTYAPCVTNVHDFGKPAYIGERTFSDCTNLAITSLPDSVTYIGNYAFYNCAYVNVREFPSNLEYLGSNAFYIYNKPNNDLKSIAMYNATIVLPSSIKTLGDHAFCAYAQGAVSYVGTLKILATQPPTLSSETALSDFSNSNGLKTSIIVPQGCGDVYKSAEYWSKYKNYISEAS